MSREKHLKKQNTRERKTGESILTIILVILLSCSAVATGIALPGLAAEIQSRKIDSYSKHEELGSGMLNLTGDDRILDKIKSLSRKDPKRLVKLEKGSSSSRHEAEAEINELFKILSYTGLAIDEDRYWDISSCEPYLLLPDEEDSENPDSYVIWIVEAGDGQGNKLKYYLDDSTGLILSAYAENIERSAVGPDIDRRLPEALNEYYSLSDMELRLPPEELHTEFFPLGFYLKDRELYRVQVEISTIFRFN